MRVSDNIGKRFGRWAVIDRAENDKHGGSKWLCQCDCGNTGVVYRTSLSSGDSTSCGCRRSELASQRGRARIGPLSPRWRGGLAPPRCKCNRCRCARSLYYSKWRAKKCGHTPCLATLEELSSTVVDKCELCGVPEMELDQRLSMDHNHNTGAFRGWLCGPCNRFVGLFEKCPVNVNAYLNKRSTDAMKTQTHIPTEGF